MSNFVGRPPFSNSLWVAIETMQFHIAQTKTFVSHPGGPNEQFGTHEKMSWGVQGNLNWMPGYSCFHFSMRNIEMSCDLDRTSRRSNANVSQQLPFVYRRLRDVIHVSARRHVHAFRSLAVPTPPLQIKHFIL